MRSPAVPHFTSRRERLLQGGCRHFPCDNPSVALIVAARLCGGLLLLL